MGNEYLLPLGIDGTKIGDTISTTRKQIVALDADAKKASQDMTNGFTNAGKAAATITSETAKATNGFKEQNKQIQANNSEFADMLTVLSSIATQQGKAFAGDKLKQYSDAIKATQTQLASVLSSATFKPEALNALEQALAGAKDESEQFITVIKFLEDNINDLNLNPQELADYSKIIKQVKAAFDEAGNGEGQFEDKTVSLKTQLRLLKEELAGLDSNDPRFIELAQQAAELNDKIGDVNDQIKLMSSDTSKLDATIQAVQGIVGVFAAAQGAVALFGDESEELQKTLLKVNAAMSILQGIQQVSALLDKNSALNIFLIKTLRTQQAVATQAVAAADVELAVAEEGATVATEALNVAMAENPAAILIIAIGALVAAYALFGSETDKEIDKQIRYNQTLQQTNDLLVALAKAFTQVYSDQTKEAERAAALAQAQGKSEQQIFALKQKALEARKLEATATLANLGMTEKDVEYNETLLQMRQEQLRALILAIPVNQELTKEDQKRIDNLKAEIAAIQSITGPARQALDTIKDTEAEIANNAAANNKKIAEDGLKSATALAEAKVILAKKGSEQELMAQITAIRAAQKEALANVDLTAGERVKINADAEKKIVDARRAFRVVQLSDEVSLIQARISESLEGSQEEYLAKKDLLDKQAKIEIENAQGNAAKIKEINADVIRKKADLDNEYELKVRTDAANTEISDVQERLAIVQKGSEQELDLKKKLVDQQSLLDIINANASIKNETLKQQKIKEIIAKANADKLLLEQDYISNQIAQQEAYQKALTDLNNSFMESIISDTSKSDKQRFEAKQQILKNEISGLEKSIENEKTLLAKGIINYEQYLTAVNNIQAQINRLQQQLKDNADNFIPQFNLGDAILKSMGFDPNNPGFKAFFSDLGNAISSAYDQITATAEAGAQRQIDAIQSVIDALDQQISEQQNVINKEKSLSDKGLANDLANQQKKLDDLKLKKAEETKAREEAQQKLEEIRKREAVVQAASILANNVESGVNMVTAATKVFKAHAGIPFVGVALAVGFVALMVATFLAIKNSIKAATADVPKFRRGGGKDLKGQLLQGPSHEQGGIGLYNDRTGKKIAEYEGGEYLFALNQKSKSKYLPLLEAINSDDTENIRKHAASIYGAERLPDINPTLHVARKVHAQEIEHQSNSLVKNDLAKLDHLEIIAENTKPVERETIIETEEHRIIKTPGRTRKIIKH